MIQQDFKPAAFHCERFGISPSTWWRLSTKTPGFPEPIRFGRAVRWSVQAVDNFMRQRQAA